MSLEQDVLIESAVIPLPPQIRALSRATTDDHVRYLLADEVDLGNTIETGLIMRELNLSGLVRRMLVIAPNLLRKIDLTPFLHLKLTPKGLFTQRVCEMRCHFGNAIVFLTVICYIII